MRMNYKNTICSLLLATVTVLGLSSCKDEIAEEARYTFTGNTVASYLEKNSEYFSSFIEILKRGGRFSLMKAYGTYTCFAPTNEAIDRYLFEQDSIYQATKDTEKPIDNGIYSPYLSELSDSMCKVIAQTHLLPEIYLTTDMEGDIIPTMNLNDRYLSVNYLAEKGRTIMVVNGSAEIIQRDEEVENGVVHALSGVLAPSSNTVPTQIGKFDYFSIFSEALEKTGIADSMQAYKDFEYNYDLTPQDHFDKGNTTTRPLSRYWGFTAFVEPDSIFALNRINSFEDLVDRCKEWYPEAQDPDFKSPENSLYQFIAYHIVPRKVIYSYLTCTDLTLSDGFDSEKNLVKMSDRTEYYETYNRRLMKITTPRGTNRTDSRRLINYTPEVINKDLEKHVNVLVKDPVDVKSSYPDFDQIALNGIVHVIDGILLYDETEMRGSVLNCIMRFDFSAIVPELVTNEVRWCSNGKAGTPHFSKNEFVLVNETGNYLEKSRHFKRFTNETRLYYLCPTMSWRNYQGDEMMALGAYDFAYKLPPVPAGTYEIRMGYSMSGKRGVVQFYIGSGSDVNKIPFEVTGIPIDLRKNGGHAIVGWVSDADAKANGDVTVVNGVEYGGLINDKEMKNRGYLKGPNTYYQGGSLNVRDDIQSLRRVITTKYLSEGEHWIRFKNVTQNDDGTAQMMHDYIEIVPLGYIRNPEISFLEKRK